MNNSNSEDTPREATPKKRTPTPWKDPTPRASPHSELDGAAPSPDGTKSPQQKISQEERYGESNAVCIYVHVCLGSIEIKV